MKDVLLFGEPMGLFIAEEVGDAGHVDRFTKGIAGAEVNVATGLSRLGFQVDFVTKLGEDPFGYFIHHFLCEEGIRTENVIFDQVHKTGLQIKERVDEGDPAVAYYRKGSAFSTITVEDVQQIDFRAIRLFHVTGIPPALNPSTREAVFYLLEKAKAADCFISFDPNLRPCLWENEATMIEVLNQIAEYADIILPGISEGELLTGCDAVEDIAAFYHEIGVYAVIIKDGGNGAYVSEKGGKLQHVPGFKVKNIVDTVGAGDGFAVGVISGFLDELELDEAASRGNAIGSIQVQHAGDNEGLPTRGELVAYMNHESKSRRDKVVTVNQVSFVS